MSAEGDDAAWTPHASWRLANRLRRLRHWVCSRASKSGDYLVRQCQRLIELKPLYVERVSGCDLAYHVIAVNNVGMSVPIRVVRALPWVARSWLGRIVRWFEPLPSREHERRRFKAYEKRLAEMMRRIKACGKSVVIIVHGGLEDPRHSVKDSARVVEAMHGECYPIFVIWDSWLSAPPEHLLLIRSGHYAATGPLTWLFVLLGYFLAGLGLLPQTVFSQIRSLYVGTRLSPDPGTRIANAVRGAPAGVRVAPATYHPRGLKSWWTPLRGLGWLLQFPLRALAAVFIDTLAPPTWQNLRRRARAMFRAPQEFEAIVAGRWAVPPGSTYASAQGAMAVFAEHLVRAIGKNEEIKVTLIAHSLGAMIANEFIQYAGDGLAYDSIVYMAPACSVRAFSDAVVPALDRNRGAQAYVLALHPKVEANEKTLHGFLPRGSVLEWLERFLDPPPAHLDRVLGKFDNVMRALHIFPPGVRDRIHVKAFSFDATDLRKPYKHTHFNDPDLRFWEKSFWWP